MNSILHNSLGMVSKFYLAGIFALLLMIGIASAGTSYVHANGKTIAKINDTGVYYYHTDNIGSTSAVTDHNGDVVEEQTNLPFGQLISGSEKYSFTHKELDETGLQYFGARYYTPVAGRFLNPDPARDGINWFVYGRNNPLKFIDPTGEKVAVVTDDSQTAFHRMRSYIDGGKESFTFIHFDSHPDYWPPESRFNIPEDGVVSDQDIQRWVSNLQIYEHIYEFLRIGAIKPKGFHLVRPKEKGESLEVEEEYSPLMGGLSFTETELLTDNLCTHIEPWFSLYTKKIEGKIMVNIDLDYFGSREEYMSYYGFKYPNLNVYPKNERSAKRIVKKLFNYLDSLGGPEKVPLITVARSPEYTLDRSIAYAAYSEILKRAKKGGYTADGLIIEPFNSNRAKNRKDTAIQDPESFKPQRP